MSTLNTKIDNFEEYYNNLRNAIIENNVKEVKKYINIFPEFLIPNFYLWNYFFLEYFRFFFSYSGKEEEKFDIFKIFIEKNPNALEEFLFESSNVTFINLIINIEYNKYIYLLIETYGDKLEKFLNKPRDNNKITYLLDYIKHFNKEIYWLFINLRVNTSINNQYGGHIVDLWINFIETYKKMIYFCFSSKKSGIPKEINQFISLKLFLKEK